MSNPTAVPNEVLDGAPPIGTHGTVSINSVSFVVLEEKITPTWTMVEDKTAIGYPNRLRKVKGRYGLALTLQLSRGNSTTGTNYPIPGTPFTYPVQNETSSPLNFVVDEVPEERNNGEAIETAKITAWQAIGAITTA